MVQKLGFMSYSGVHGIWINTVFLGMYEHQNLQNELIIKSSFKLQTFYL